MTHPVRLAVSVLLGSVRRDRQGLRVARMMMQALSTARHDPVLVDPMELSLPLLDRMYEEYPPGEAPAVLEGLATLYRAADGFVIVNQQFRSTPPRVGRRLEVGPL